MRIVLWSMIVVECFTHPWAGYRKRELTKADRHITRVRNSLMDKSDKAAFLANQAKEEGFYSTWFKYMVESASLKSASNHVESLKHKPYFWENLE